MLMCLYASGMRRFHCGSSARSVAARNSNSTTAWCFAQSIDATIFFSASTFSAADRDARISPKWRSEPCFELLWAELRMVIRCSQQIVHDRDGENPNRDGGPTRHAGLDDVLGIIDLLNG
jgi:hypothetical protein